MNCICKASIPKGKRGEVTNAKGKLLLAFHTACPEHGVTVVTDQPMIRVARSNWVTKQEAIDHVAFYRAKENLRIVRRTPDGQQALLEWDEWLSPLDQPGQGQ